MANTINDLYLKYVNKVGGALEKDRYFQYLFEMVRAGENTLSQKKQVLHKVVDERWLTTIEESLDAINAIIEKPRRFVTTSEEVVPVALARKITADSVRHLSMNTQYIASDEGGEIQPTRVLNVSTEESYDLYENRFIYHLIQRLVTFIDKRTDVIFWSTGDEINNVLSYSSKVDDAYEEIEYRLEMKIKNRQSFAENDSDNMQVFMRIDRVRRLVMALRNSSFCSIMNGCAKVRSPIQRTNLMMKDPNYRTCYKLWQFLESYEEIGYTIQAQDTSLEFDEEYLLQLYTNLITNYTVFKSILDGTDRDVTADQPKRRRVIKPKFIKKIDEQIVDDYDLPDVEVRRVIIEEVTQAQLDAEEKLSQMEQTLAETQSALEALESQMATLQKQLFSAVEQATAAEEQTVAAEREKQQLSEQLEAEQVARAEAERRASTEKQRREASEKQAAKELSEIEKQNSEQLAEVQEKAKADIESANSRADAAEQRAESEIRRIRLESDAALENAQANAMREIETAKDAAKIEIENANSRAESEISAAREELERVRRESEESVAAVTAESENAVRTAQEARLFAEMKLQEEQSAREKAQKEALAASEARAKAESEAENHRKRADSEAKARLKAEEKAEANSLSKYIVTALNNRRSKSDTGEDEK